MAHGWARAAAMLALIAVSAAFSPYAGFPAGTCGKRVTVQALCTRKAMGGPVRGLALRRARTALRSSEGSDDKPLTLSAYDQLVLSVRAMNVKEIQNELKTRAVSFDDCFEKEDLVGRLVEARLQIAAEALGEGDLVVDPEKKEVKVVPVEEEKEKPKAPEPPKADNFGSAEAAQNFLKTMSPQKIQKMMGDQELIAAVRNPNVMRMAQEVMQDPKAMAKYENDPDVLKAIQKIKDFMTSK
mmetsp:Transcript_55755/g.136582  ORF Transcript_55755/g.136582 Transcript_55755/m.136582 type:complete len:241 (+) Transcript_55755:14-736(+)|eukprot:CAMPEP_0206235998 /NCGR_PEP_ID=MMETSP0047_2-20121206/13466_1 /ASSEMBLY_ACC=CAM_ASM_000192 /TAXON_ID=195065 /ORGANISM="Chroomonas mesostigmatica_cf, Strain CCMP1168" /LENGTH=240 /DNA_ID=CAMNT_0053660275 /DNA_START=12 /DNA_END=734 /DNA_ORIENTATION=+